MSSFIPLFSSRRLLVSSAMLSIFFVVNIVDSCFCPVYPADKTGLFGKEQDNGRLESTYDDTSEEEEAGRAYYDFGVFAYEDGDYEDAEKNFKNALKFNPDSPFYNHYLGKTYLKMERYQEAENYLEKAWEVNPDISGLKYDMALLNYKTSKYSRAADLFAEIVEEDPSNVLAYYQAGISLYKQKRYGKSLDYLIGAAEKSPTLKANSYYYAGICYQKIGRIEKAVEKFEYVKENADSESLREYAIKGLEGIEKQKAALKPYSIYLKIGYQYNDNVPLEPLDEDIYEDIYEVKYEDEADFATVGYFSGRYNLVERDDYEIGAGYDHYQTVHNSLKEWDLVASRPNLYIKYRFYPFSFGFSYLPSYYWVESDSYLMRHQLNPEVTWKVNENLATRFSYSYYKNNYLQDDNDKRDGNTNDIFLDVYYSILDNRGRLFGGIGYEDNSASHSDYYYDQLKTKLGISLKIPWGLNLSLTGRYYDREYDNVDSDYGVKRKDTKYKGSISLSRRFLYDWLSILVEFDYTEKNSNIDVFDYKRNRTTLSLEARY